MIREAIKKVKESSVSDAGDKGSAGKARPIVVVKQKYDKKEDSN